VICAFLDFSTPSMLQLLAALVKQVNTNQDLEAPLVIFAQRGSLDQRLVFRSVKIAKEGQQFLKVQSIKPIALFAMKDTMEALRTTLVPNVQSQGIFVVLRKASILS
jgi:hypothetical protein